MVLYGNDRDRLRVPFVRPEDDEVFRHISTANVLPEKQKLNATAAPFVLAEKPDLNGRQPRPRPQGTIADDAEAPEPTSPTVVHTRGRRRGSTRSRRSTNENKQTRDSSHGGALSGKEDATGSESSRRESSAGVWGSWRHGPSGGHEKDATPISGYQPAPTRSSRGMKTLKASKSSSAKTGAAYEVPLPSRSDSRRKSQVSVGGEIVNGGNKRDPKRSNLLENLHLGHASKYSKK
ncbi:ubiquitin carboxyl-terminal hydrolase 19 [Cordyceps fumosorosea ARSEF 2679]|uniref:Ubiquitin carboxyl-terminal hydrolase 19 n=1 Tax=Cordyceps fumosorosea (strain ARSEF 2679) TaxID=1081104 RepID=A0A162MS89_CORFA|nr:ubiquitin carboxyl-terminal hydrolase 19 [Cordyceps fumosorosea ARSEF 2679]OAA69439.1 ubiquitin carboxyl-terminal hydrolase 19 [Cordyceps fumosorosea ARSEF 2679]